MFNGIIYNKGIVKSIRKSPNYVSGSLVIEIASKIRFKQSDIGESVSCVWNDTTEKWNIIAYGTGDADDNLVGSQDNT